jgi:glycosyltransferase involved in cell wall biosynthesis
MRLLLITFELDESHGTLAWQVKVAKKLAERVDHLTIITSTVGRVEQFPDNVEIITIPRRPLGIPRRLGGNWAFNKHVFDLCRRRRIDGVFVHMAMEWVYILAPTFRLLNLPVVVWYAHGTVSLRLRAAIACADRVVTSTPEGCRVSSRKVMAIGQGIDLDRFGVSRNENRISVLYVGRISPRKRVDLIIDVAEHMHKSHEASPPFEIVGPILTDVDMNYDHDLRDRIWRSGLDHAVSMVGFVPEERLPEFHAKSAVHLNLSQTGSMDKTVMEALASGRPVLTTNEAFFDILSAHPDLILRDDRPEAIAERIRHVRQHLSDYDGDQLRALVADRHSLETYADRVLHVIKECRLGRRCE